MNTKSEDLFEEFLGREGIKHSRIEQVQNQRGQHRPDYLIEIGTHKLIFELKQFGNDDVAEYDDGWSTKPGKAIRNLIARSRKQIQYGANKGIASILLVYNNTDPVFQLRGTEETDFRAAMFGEVTILIDKKARSISEPFHGGRSELQEGKNTSFSSVGHLCNRSGMITITLWENPFAEVPLPFEEMPLCFNVQRIGIDRSPLMFAKTER